MKSEVKAPYIWVEHGVSIPSDEAMRKESLSWELKALSIGLGAMLAGKLGERSFGPSERGAFRFVKGLGGLVVVSAVGMSLLSGNLGDLVIRYRNFLRKDVRVEL